MMSFQHFVDIKVSVATIILWVVGAVTAITGVSTMYGEQKQRIIAVEQRMDRLERSQERIEASSQRVEFSLARIEGKVSSTKPHGEQ